MVMAMAVSGSALAGCEAGSVGDVLTGYYDQVMVKPRPWGLADTPEGSPLFRKGWEEGCNTGLGVYGGTHYHKPAYRFQQDLTLINNDEYYRAWRDAYAYCRWYAWNWNRDARH